MDFVDQVELKIRSGSGGDGAVAFRREKHVPRGGPSGGDGGHGGAVWLEASEDRSTLLSLRGKKHQFAENGEAGRGSKQRGADGDDLRITVPCGTVARDKHTGEILGEVLEDGDELLLAEGGKGGKGNSRFASATEQTPRYAEDGEPGEEREIVLELKLLADVGLVGFPNSGKSTLISSISAAKPEIAGYPFTTVQPNLGVVFLDEFTSFVMADIPGIIEGAHEGKGMGLQFLRHIERNAVLLFVISVLADDPAGEYRTLRDELKAYQPSLVEKPQLVTLTMMDVLTEDERESFDPRGLGFPSSVRVVPTSAVANIGLNDLKHRLWEMVRQHSPRASSRSSLADD